MSLNVFKCVYLLEIKRKSNIIFAYDKGFFM